MKISDIIHREEYILCEISENIEFNRLVTSVDEMKSDDLLIIANPENSPDFSEASELPLAVICGINIILPDNIPSIRVSDPRLTMALAFYRYEKPALESMRIIGITGTNGKTTTATMTEHILGECGYKTAFIGTGRISIGERRLTDDNYSMTTPDPALLYHSLRQMSDEKCDVVIMEVSSHSLALNKLAPLKFDIGVFTNLSPEHTDFHKDMDNYFRSKLKLFDNCDSAIINIDDEYGRRIFDLFGKKKSSVGVIWRGDVWASNIENMGFDGIGYLYHGRDFSFKMRLPTPGSFNVYNSMLAAALCIELGCKPCRVKEILAEQKNADGRYEIIKDDISVIIDYAHTSEAFQSILKDLSQLKGEGRLTVIFGCGGNRDRSKRAVMAKIAEKYADNIILTSDNSRNEDIKDIISDIIKGFDKGNYNVREDRAIAIENGILTAKKGDIVAIIGKGAEKYNIDKKGYHSFDERKIILSALQKRKEM